MIQAPAEQISKVEAWILASRPKTLLASAVPVIMGTSIAVRDGKGDVIAALVALICAFLIQIGTNFVNDLYDHLAGTDHEGRLGPQRALANNWLTVKEIKIGIFLTFLISFLLGLYLVHLAGWIILLIGILSIIAGILYTAGPFPLAYNGLGDIFVFIFFGFIGTVGTYYVQTLRLNELIFWVSIPVGALITNILVVNNYRDRVQDQKSGKYTLAVKLGDKFTRLQYLIFMVVSYVIPFIVYFTYHNSLWVFLPLFSFPIALKLIKMIYRLRGKELNKTLELTAKLSAIYGLLFAVGVLI